MLYNNQRSVDLKPSLKKQGDKVMPIPNRHAHVGNDSGRQLYLDKDRCAAPARYVSTDREHHRFIHQHKAKLRSYFRPITARCD